MLYRRLLTPAFSFLLITCAAHMVAQSGRGGVGNVKVRVLYSDSRPAAGQLRVRLMNGASTNPINEAFTSAGGMVEFSAVPIGNYHVVVTGEEIDPADSGGFEVDNRKVAQTQFVTVHRVRDANASQPGTGPPLVSAADLRVPDAAKKQFSKASEAMTRQDWKKALTLLNRSISIYPQYASAYNNLGVVYTQMQDAPHAHEALEKAISLNDHFASALQNLAKLHLQEKNPVQAETLLEKAVAVEPTNAQSLLLLAQAELLDRHFDAAIASARKILALPHEHMAVAHYIAARALENERRLQEAIAELQAFLQEEPQGPRAAQAREETIKIQRAVSSAAPSTVAR